MKKVCFLLPQGLIKSSSLFGAIEVFETANQYFRDKGKPPFYEIKISGVGGEQPILEPRLAIRPINMDYKKVKPDIIIIPGLQEDIDCVRKESEEVFKWIISRYNTGCEVASLCTGAFFLAATGLLNGQECSTHWKAEGSFSKMYPDVKVCRDKIITDNKRIYTAGGAFSSLNLILYLIEKHVGRQAALYCSKILQIDIDRDSQSQFILFEGQKNHGDLAIKKAQQFIERKVDEKVSVEFLAQQFGISKRSFIRRFKKATGNVPVEYIQKVKIESAKRSLETKIKNITEVMYSVGYTDIKAFRNIFKKVTGLTPIEYKLKFSNL